MISIGHGNIDPGLVRRSREEFRNMASEHSSYERRLQELDALDHLTLEQEAEEHRLKKLKLHLKDQMTGMLSHGDLQAV